MMTWASRIIKDGASRVDFERELVVFRKARVLSPRTNINDFNFVDAKYDGNRSIVAKSEIATLHAFTTKPRDMAEYYPEHPLWRKLNECLAHEEWLDGELFVPGRGREAVKTALATCDDALSYAAFGCSFVPRDASMEKLHDALVARGLENFRSVWSYAVEDLCGKQVRERAGANCDGIVLKQSMYGAWCKLKNKRDIDLVVTGVKPGVGKYTGMCGSLHGSVMLPDGIMHEVCCCSGMDDSVRESITERDVGRVFEVEYERVGSRCRLQHPRFTRWRDDEKKPVECTPDQDPDLEKMLCTAENR